MFIHPTIATKGIRIWVYNDTVKNFYYYHMNEIFTVIMCSTMIKLLINITYKSQYATARSQRVCDLFGCEASRSYIIKCLIKDSPLYYISITLFIAVFFFGYCGMVAEAPLDRLNLGFQEYTFVNALWVAMGTFFTSGYGDILPIFLLFCGKNTF